MIAVLSAATAPFGSVPLPLAAMLAISAAALVTIGVVVRRMRVQGTLTFAHALTGAAAASFVIAASLLAGASVSAPTQAAAAEPAQSQTRIATTTVDDFQPIAIDGLEGYQLPTE